MVTWFSILVVAALAALGVYDAVAAGRVKARAPRIWHVIRAVAAGMLIVTAALPTFAGSLDWSAAWMLLLFVFILGGLALVLSTVVLSALAAGRRAAAQARRTAARH